MQTYLPVGAVFDLVGEAYKPPAIPAFVFTFKETVAGYIPPPRITLGVSCSWSKSNQRLGATDGSKWAASVPKNDTSLVAWGRATVVEVVHSAHWIGLLSSKDLARALCWDELSPQDAGAPSAWNNPPPLDVAVGAPWDHSIGARDVRLRLIYNPRPAIRDAVAGLPWHACDQVGQRYDYAQELLDSLYIPGPGPLHFSFGGARYQPATAPQVFFDFRHTPLRRAIQPVDARSAAVGYKSASVIDLLRLLRWGWGTPTDPIPTGIEYPDYAGPVVVIDTLQPPAEPDILESYMIANTVTLVVLPERTPLDAQNIRVALDIDSFSWSFSADLLGQTSLNLVRPDADGQKTVELDINGWKWLMLIERYSRTQKFPAEHYSINGASRSQLLATPYAPPRSAVNSAAITAQQAAAAQLTNTGFTLTWDALNNNPPDWTLPAGALSYQDQSALQVIARIAAAAGAIVRPARDSDALSVLPRYRAPVWEWPTAIMDRIIPTDIVTSLGGEWAPQPAWNSCYVSGTNFGVAMDVRRAGTAGDHPAPDVLDDLITGTEVARQRGICEISQGGNQEIVSQVIPLFAAGTVGNPGLVEPAMLCEIRGDGDTWRGLCLSTEISAAGVGAARVTQTLRLERHTGGGY